MHARFFFFGTYSHAAEGKFACPPTEWCEFTLLLLLLHMCCAPNESAASNLYYLVHRSNTFSAPCNSTSCLHPALPDTHCQGTCFHVRSWCPGRKRLIIMTVQETNERREGQNSTAEEKRRTRARHPRNLRLQKKKYIPSIYFIIPRN